MVWGLGLREPRKYPQVNLHLQYLTHRFRKLSVRPRLVHTPSVVFASVRRKSIAQGGAHMAPTSGDESEPFLEALKNGIGLWWAGHVLLLLYSGPY